MIVCAREDTPAKDEFDDSNDTSSSRPSPYSTFKQGNPKLRVITGRTRHQEKDGSRGRGRVV